MTFASPNESAVPLPSATVASSAASAAPTAATPLSTAPNEARFLSPLAGEELLFRRLLWREELGRLPELRLELLRSSQKAPLAAERLLGQPAAVALRQDDDTERFLHGLVTHVERGGHVGRFDVYRVHLRPWLWQLTLGADCRIFQDRTVLEILEEVFAAYPGAGPVEKRLHRARFARRPCTVQYNESDFNFIARLLEDEGLYFFFRHERERHVLVLCDSPASHRPAPSPLRWNEAQGEVVREDVILQWTRAQTLQPQSATSTDFAAEQPGADLRREATRSAAGRTAGPLERHLYPGGHDDLSMSGDLGGKRTQGAMRMRHQVDRFDSQAVVAQGTTPYRALSVGQTLDFSGHDDAGRWLVTGAITDMEFSGYEANADARSTSYLCRFAAVPATVAYQPPAAAWQPRIQGPQTAIVTGPAGEEIHVDRHGRVKVQFHWDRRGQRNERSSCWVRVSHPWAGKGFGMVALPRVGDEVIVEFLDGWPDRPMITGRVYNGEQPAPYALPAHATVSGVRTRSSKGGGPGQGNELRFEDARGTEHVWMKAERDLHHWVGQDQIDSVQRDARSSVGRDAQLDVGGDLSIGVGRETRLKMDRDVHASLGADLLVGVDGAVDVAIGAGLTLKADGPVSIDAGGPMDVSLGQGARVTATGPVSVQAMALTLEATATLSLRVGASFITLGPEGISIMGPQIRLYSGRPPLPAVPAVTGRPAAPKAPGAMPDHQDPLGRQGGAR
ncbi:type VI secretion system Vgr family protein [Roseateles amylovorans]|uniref:Type VI secretion system tip protein VgrG n=1 Tax=Roseateles amylovorans TaxID=2978473 RepID=A0ABY6AT91_9BURK|nr:type VI secretion system tip protein TssI/VgrG [Roseateles amylovorans]UXH76148.1 type VI secretion system tip protein VgrG [Roseateles amylovorans]